MHEVVAFPLRAWETFYVIVGSSAGALTGLQFVVPTIIAEAGLVRGRKEAIAAFGSPNIVHFCAALLLASILSAPWHSMLRAGVAVSGCGVLGVVYSALVLRRTLRQRTYRPVLEDRVWHTILPTLAYSTLFVTGAVLERNSASTLFVIGAALLLLVFIGIHNAWDTLTFVTLQRGESAQSTEGGAVGNTEARGGAGGAGPGPSPASGVGGRGDPPG